MDKKQQIEEMARVACEHFDYDMVDQPCKKCKTYDKHCYTIHKAEILYNAGYRKIDDDCAVITKTELKQYKLQAVKEFSENLKEKALSHCKTINCYECKFIETTIDELLEEYDK